jgi:protease I
MKSVLFVLAPEDFKDEEFFIPKEIFEKADFQITVASKGTKKAKSISGQEVLIEKDIRDININQYDALIFIGGLGAKVFFHDNDAQKLAIEAHNQEKILAAICIAPSILANAGLLIKRKVTAYPSEKTNIEEHGGFFRNSTVEVDEKLVTASGPKAAKEFGETIRDILLYD